MCRDFAITLKSANLVTTEDIEKAGWKQFQDVVDEMLNGVMIARIDSMLAHLELTLKAAATLGHTFCAWTLYKSHPNWVSLENVVSYLDELVRAGFLDKISKEAFATAQSVMSMTLFSKAGEILCDGSDLNVLQRDGVQEEGLRCYTFRFPRCRKVAISMMLHTQRQQLHESYAKHLEKQSSFLDIRGFRGGMVAFPSLYSIAHHWLHSEQSIRCLGYLQEIGSNASLNLHCHTVRSSFVKNFGVLKKKFPPNLLLSIVNTQNRLSTRTRKPLRLRRMSS